MENRNDPAGKELKLLENGIHSLEQEIILDLKQVADLKICIIKLEHQYKG